LKQDMTRLDQLNPQERTIQEHAEVILGSLDLEDEEINKIVEEWCSCDFEIGQMTRCLTKLQRIAFEYLLKRDNLWGDYRRQLKNRTKPDGIALPVEE